MVIIVNPTHNDFNTIFFGNLTAMATSLTFMRPRDRVQTDFQLSTVKGNTKESNSKLLYFCIIFCSVGESMHA